MAVDAVEDVRCVCTVVDPQTVNEVVKGGVLGLCRNTQVAHALTEKSSLVYLFRSYVNMSIYMNHRGNSRWFRLSRGCARSCPSGHAEMAAHSRNLQDGMSVPITGCLTSN